MKRLGLALLLSVVAPAVVAACDPPGVAALVVQLGAQGEQQRWDAATALGRCGADAVPALVKALASDAPHVRRGAARALGTIGAPAKDAVPTLVAALADPEPLVRESAAEALGRIGPAAAPAIKPLIEAFADDDAYLAGVSAVALARIGSACVPALTAALGDTRDHVRESAAITLARLGAPAAAASAALVRALDDAQPAIRIGAATALGAIGQATASTTAALTNRLSDADENVRRAVRIALAQLGPPRPAPAREDVIATIERLVPALMQEHHVPGVSIALIGDGEVAWSKPFGVADAASGAPVTKETLFEAASMSKPVFAMIVLQLVDAGRLDLDRPLTSYAREPFVPDQAAKQRITARMVLSHTSGLPNWRPGGEERESPLPLLSEPGSRFGYSGEGIFYLQRVVEQLTGQPLGLRARASLFEPLGLAHSSYAFNPDVDRLLAAGHGATGTRIEKSTYTHDNAAYTLYTTAEEYARLVVEVMRAAAGNSKQLSQKSAREMLRHQVTLDARDPIERPGAAQGRTVHWGLGWSVNTTAAGDIFHHSGANQTGFRCFSQFSPARRSGLVILTNGTGGSELWTRLVAAIGDL